MPIHSGIGVKLPPFANLYRCGEEFIFGQFLKHSVVNFADNSSTADCQQKFCFIAGNFIDSTVVSPNGKLVVSGVSRINSRLSHQSPKGR
jgi:hypothetical protein